MSPDHGFNRALLKWYDRHRRDLPWRAISGEKPDPYAVLVSELMLQQTQVATVIPYFLRFMERFPRLVDLADAPEQEVLRLWQGLGYYSRARNLQASALIITRDFGGAVPRNLTELLTLPGVGRYTAGAVASIAYDQRTPIVDGNIARVLSRIDRIEADPRSAETIKRLWARAEQILPAKRAGDFNTAMMELGATVCTPRTPRCVVCPVRKFCKAAAAGVQESIPKSKKAKVTPLNRRLTICIRNEERWLIEQRPSIGRWAGMWQFITMEAGAKNPTARQLQTHLGVRVTTPQLMGKLKHALTHRRYEFDVYLSNADGDALSPSDRPRRWIRLQEMSQVPLSRPHSRIVEMLMARHEEE
ncbi:MAG: A/G-specific adenine glycosylase [Planctomycetota bacterium]|nr:A/G-specific adenine glycosylase [Planctomycetota bacterium]